MSYSNTYDVLDLTGGFPQQAVRLWWAWTEVGGPTAVENQQEADLLIQPDSTGPLTRPFTSLRDLTPPSPAWSVALSIQDNPLLATDQGWIFRSGRFQPDLPTDPIEVILAQDQFLNQADIDASLPALPLVSQTTTITSMSAIISGSGLSLTATGTDTGAPGVTFTYTATLNLFPNANVSQVDEPLGIGLANPSLSFGGGFLAPLLNLLNGIILRDVSPQIRSTLQRRMNASILTAVATRFAKQPTTTLPSGVVMSLRQVRFTSRTTPSGSEPVVAILGALGAFGGVLSKFPQASGGGQCFIATAAVGPNSQEVRLLRDFRDNHLLRSRAGRMFVGIYEYFSPPLARLVTRSLLLRKITRRLIVEPAAFLVQQYSRRATGTNAHSKRGKAHSAQ
jgi:hypothetical protein